MRYFLLALLFVLAGLPLAQSQVYTDPYFPRADQPVTIYFDATQGTGGLANCNCNIYLHSGLITAQSTSPNDWKFVFTTWGVANPAWQMTPVPGQPNLYRFTIPSSIRAFYNVPASETILKMAFVFRNANGSLEGKGPGGSDIFYDVYPASLPFTGILLTPTNRTLVTEAGSAIPIRFVTSATATIQVFDNGNLLTQTSGTSLDYTIQAAPGTHAIEVVANNGSTEIRESFSYAVAQSLPPADPPAGTKLGINYLTDSSIRLSLFAPNKQYAFVVGDFNNWSPQQMQRSTDGSTYWIDISGLSAGNYAFQYLLNGGLAIADPYSTLVLDPAHDSWISPSTWPGLPAYPSGRASGIVSLIQMGTTPYIWQTENFQRPPKEKLVIYELLIRDFVAARNYQTLIDSLDYLERLGVNAIELMPVNEFEGNESWGYNASFHMALDKYYGTPTDFKRFVDACHQRGIAVILDVVYNHAFSQCPLVQMYWDSANSRPAANNPWLNPIARHPFNVGYDFNHEAQATKDYVTQVMQYWLSEYRVDGFRVDLSKGFTQTFTTENNAMSSYDQSRVNILKYYADRVWDVSPGAYVILEHFAANNEEQALSAYGMMLWGNMNHEFNEGTMGYSSNLNWASWQARSWSQPNLVTYMESHDEERLMYKNLQFGNINGAYNTRQLNTALRRMELASVFLYAIPGPRMIWQFGELGYDFSIFTCSNGTVSNGDTGCKLSPKPIRWDYYQHPGRRRLFDINSAMIHLKKQYAVFSTNNFTLSSGTDPRKKLHLLHPEMNVAVLGNFGMSQSSMSSPFPTTGWWYEYFTGDSIQVLNTSSPMTLAAGEYRLYSTVKLPPPSGGFVTSSAEVLPLDAAMAIAPNPAASGMTSSLQLALPERGNIRLMITDMAGRTIGSVLYQGQLEMGEHQFDLPDTLPAGAYLVRLEFNRQLKVQKWLVY
jgi:glycosidase